MQNPLNNKNILIENLLQAKITDFGEILKSGFNFGSIRKNTNPKEFFAAAVLNKLYSLNVSLENVLLANDVFLSQYLYRYVYELYTKVLYIFSGVTEKETLLRLDNFFKNIDLKMKDYMGGIETKYVLPSFKKEHQEYYKEICQMVHPNINSLNIHMHTADQQFGLLSPTVNLILWYNIEIIKFFSTLKLLNLDKKINQKKLVLLQNN